MKHRIVLALALALAALGAASTQAVAAPAPKTASAPAPKTFGLSPGQVAAIKAGMNPLRVSAPLEIATVPKIKGVALSLSGRTYRTNGAGLATLPPEAKFGGYPTISDTEIADGVRARFALWFGEPYGGRVKATFNVFYRVQLRLFDLAGKPVDPKLVTSLTLKSSLGVRSKVDGSKPFWLKGKRVVPLNHSLQAKDIYYTVESVVIDGTNVVNRSQQKFIPAESRDVTVRLLFYATHFVARDAFFGFSTGSRVRLEFPDGRVERYELDRNGELLLPSLPRGDYQVSVEGSGVSFTRPVSVSRNQEVELEVLTYLDMGVAALALVGILVALPLLRRRRLRGRRAVSSGTSLPGEGP